MVSNGSSKISIQPKITKNQKLLWKFEETQPLGLIHLFPITFSVVKIHHYHENDSYDKYMVHIFILYVKSFITGISNILPNREAFKQFKP